MTQSLEKSGQLAFSIPTRGTVGEPFHVDAQLTVDGLIHLETTAPQSEVTEHAVPVGPEMQAELKGDDFKITADSPAAQNLTPATVAEWEWDVTPMNAGKDTLDVSLWTVSADGVGIDTLAYSKNIDVAVQPHRFGRWLSANWAAVAGTAIGVAGLVSGIVVPLTQRSKKRGTRRTTRTGA